MIEEMSRKEPVRQKTKEDFMLFEQVIVDFGVGRKSETMRFQGYVTSGSEEILDRDGQRFAIVGDGTARTIVPESHLKRIPGTEVNPAVIAELQNPPPAPGEGPVSEDTVFVEDHGRTMEFFPPERVRQLILEEIGEEFDERAFKDVLNVWEIEGARRDPRTGEYIILLRTKRHVALKKFVAAVREALGAYQSNQ